MKTYDSIFWFRRDLRLKNNLGLKKALEEGGSVLPLFIFDSNILTKLDDDSDKRITFIMDSLIDLEKSLNKFGSALEVRFGDPLEIIKQIQKENSKLKKIYNNQSYGIYGRHRDKIVKEFCLNSNIEFVQSEDQYGVSPQSILNGSGLPYKVFTPFRNRWLEIYQENLPKLPSSLKKSSFCKSSPNRDLIEEKLYKKIKFKKFDNLLIRGGEALARKSFKTFLENRIEEYHLTRDFPAISGTSSLSPYIRFGNLSIQEIIQKVMEVDDDGHEKWLDEIIWREFYASILFHFPESYGQEFKLKYRSIKWKQSSFLHDKFTQGETGFPIIDASIRCLNQTGLLHNRLRMVVASFYCKNLFLDWRKGERYFASKLLDYDLASNVGGWQWGSSTGCDSAPYFRIFNPMTQSKRFDKDAIFIKRYCPELKDVPAKEIHKIGEGPNKSYQDPIIDYKNSREECLEIFKSV